MLIHHARHADTDADQAIRRRGAAAISAEIICCICSRTYGKSWASSTHSCSCRVPPPRLHSTAFSCFTRSSIPMTLPAISLKCSISGLRPPLDSPGPASVTSSCPHSSATRFDTVALLRPVISDTLARETGDCVRMVCRIIDLLIFLTSA